MDYNTWLRGVKGFTYRYGGLAIFFILAYIATQFDVRAAMGIFLLLLLYVIKGCVDIFHNKRGGIIDRLLTHKYGDSKLMAGILMAMSIFYGGFILQMMFL